MFEVLLQIFEGLPKSLHVRRNPEVGLNECKDEGVMNHSEESYRMGLMGEED